jgi:diguanylate cyclase (GGDEF)-like protein/PAS domain S-box-containing protein
MTIEPQNEPQNAVGMLTMSIEGVILSGNNMLCNLLGYTNEELLTKTQSQITHADDLVQDLAMHAELRNRDTARFIDKRFVHKNGTAVHVHAITTLVQHDTQYYLCVFEHSADIIVPSAYDDTFQQLVRGLDEYAIFKISNSGKILTWNKGVEWNFGHAEKEFIGNSYKILFTPNDAMKGAMESEMRTAEKNGSVSIARYSICKDMNQIHTIGTVNAYKDKNGVADGFVVILHDDTIRKHAEDSLQHVAYHDALTELPNRELFKERVGLALSLARRSEHLVAILLIDLDNFKTVNDTYGHVIGDIVLKEFAAKLKKAVRAEDIVARLSGDEFIILLPKIRSHEEAITLAEKILQMTRECMFEEVTEIKLTASIGVSFYPKNEKSIHGLLHFADTAMYEAKRAGGSQYCCNLDKKTLNTSTRLTE